MINDVICVLSEDLIWFIYISPFFAEDDEGWGCGGQGRQEKGKLAKRMKGVYIWTGNIHIKKRNRGLEDNWKKKYPFRFVASYSSLVAFGDQYLVAEPDSSSR